MTFTPRPLPDDPRAGASVRTMPNMAYLALALVLVLGFLGGLLVGHLAVRTRVVRTERIVRIIEHGADSFNRTVRGR